MTHVKWYPCPIQMCAVYEGVGMTMRMRIIMCFSTSYFKRTSKMCNSHMITNTATTLVPSIIQESM